MFTSIFYSKNNRKYLARKKWNYMADAENRLSFINDTEITDTINSVLSNEIKKWGIESLSRFRSNGASAIIGHKKSFTLPLKKVHFL